MEEKARAGKPGKTVETTTRRGKSNEYGNEITDMAKAKAHRKLHRELKSLADFVLVLRDEIGTLRKQIELATTHLQEKAPENAKQPR